MLILTIQVDAPAGQAQGVKEQLAAILERWGDTRVVRVEELAGIIGGGMTANILRSALARDKLPMEQWRQIGQALDRLEEAEAGREGP